jgi:release factor glutamine methyltransferase
VSLAATLASARRRLAQAGIEDAGLEAEVLLRHALSWSREQLLARLDEEAPQEALCRFEGFLARRLAREPAAYITGHREFFGLDFEVTPATLVPRPETELLVEAAIEVAKPRGRIRRGPVLADIGTGCGAIAVALALNVPRADVYAVDTSPEALAVAERNAERHGVASRVLFYRGDLLAPLPEFADVLVANLPYVPTAEWERLPPELRDHEPRTALDGGADGLDVIRDFLAEAPRFLRPRGCVCLEFGFGQAQAVKDIARRHFPGHTLEVRRDLAGIERVLVVSPRD